MVRIHAGQPVLLGKRMRSPVPAQISAGSTSPKVKFPKIIRHRKADAIIYGTTKNYSFYRVVYRANGVRRMKSLQTYPEAKAIAERVVREIANGS